MNVFYKLKYPNDGEDLYSIVSVLLYTVPLSLIYALHDRKTR
jgi:hypothetical protein